MTRRIEITDHAVLRYMERVLGVDVAAVRAEIRARVRLAEAHEGAEAVLADGVRFAIEGNAVVTVMLHTRPNVRTGRQRPERRDGRPEAEDL